MLSLEDLQDKELQGFFCMSIYTDVFSCAVMELIALMLSNLPLVLPHFSSQCNCIH